MFMKIEKWVTAANNILIAEQGITQIIDTHGRIEVTLSDF